MPAPGSTVTTTIRSGPPSPTVPAAGTMFLAYPIRFGPTDWTPLRSVADAEAVYGASALLGANSGGAPIRGDLATFFEHGGELAYVKRLVGPDAEAAAIGLLDEDDATVFSIYAATVGSWGNAIRVAAAAGSTSGFKVTISHATDAFQPLVFDNLADGPAAVAAINSHPVASRFVATYPGDEGAGIAVPSAAANLTGGDDDVAGIGPLDGTPPAELGAGVIVGPFTSTLTGYTPADLAAFLDLANERRRLVFVSAPIAIEYLTPGSEQLADDIATIADNAYQAALDEGLSPYTDAITATIDRLSGVGVFHPPLAFAGPSRSIGGQVTAVGAVAGLRARAHATEGPHRAPAGEAGILDGVTAALYGPVDEAAAAAIDAAGANAIRGASQSGRVYGYKPIRLSLAPTLAAQAATVAALEDERWPLLTARDVVNVAAAEADAIAERYVMRPIDPRGHVFADLRRDLLGLGERMAAAGSLYARIDRVTRATVDPGYAADTGPDVNTEETIAAGRILGVLSIRPTPSAPFVDITVAKVALTSAI